MSENEIKTVLPAHLSGGPHGLGDPNDTTLRTSERKILIPQIMRERARKFKCIPEVKEFEKCAKETGIMMPFKCQKPTDKMKECLAYWFYNEDFKNECTKIYFDERSEYRRTGISKKQKQRMEAERQQIEKNS